MAVLRLLPYYRDAADFRQQAPSHCGIGQTIDHNRIPIADDDPDAAVPDQGRLEKDVDIFSQLSEFSHSSSPFPRVTYSFLAR